MAHPVRIASCASHSLAHNATDTSLDDDYDDDDESSVLCLML